MKKQLNLAVLALATTIFAGVLANTSPVKAEAYDDFIIPLHSKSFLRVETGMNFTVALTTENEVYTFGRNNLGQLGNDTLVDSNEAINITSFFALPTNYIITDIDAGDNHALAVATDTVTQNKKIYLWGDNSFNQLGLAFATSAFEKKPRDMSSVLVVGGIVNKAIAAEANTIVWTQGNFVYTTGRNTFGVLGNNSVTERTTPGLTTFSGMPANSIVDVGLYANTAYALTSTGLVYVWGNNASRQVGNNSANATINLPTNITTSFGLTAPEKVVSVATGENHSVALTSAGKIFFWGTVLNNSIAEALTNFTVKETPFNVTSYFYNPTPNDDWPLFGPEAVGDDYYQIPIAVAAGSDSTFFKLDSVEDFGQGIQRTNYEEFVSMGKNTHNGIYALIDWEEEDAVITEPTYISYQYYNDGGLQSISFSKTNLILLNKEGDFTMYGSNEYGQMGLGFDSEPGVTEVYNYNYSYNVRDFENYVYSELPANLTAPLDNYFDDPARSDEYYAVYGYWVNDNYRNPGIIDYYFGDYFTDKEWDLITPAQLTKMRSIFAEIFEDQVLYGWVPATNEELLTYVKDNLEDRYWLREDMEAMANYGSWELSWDDLVTLDDETIDLLDANVEPRLDEFRALLANIISFENDVLQPFIDALTVLEASNSELYDFVYVDEDDNSIEWLDLYQANVGQLIELGYEDDILAIFAAYEELSELEQLLLTEYYGWNYEHLYLEYYEYFADTYADALYDFEFDVQEEDWGYTWPLFENLAELEALLEGIEDLNEISFEMFTAMYGQENEFFEYEMYEYWMYLNEILPALQEGKPVYDQIVVIENLIEYDDDYAYVELEDVAVILAMYEDFLALSEDAQDLIDPEYAYWLYSLALEALANQAYDELGNIYDIEDEFGTDGLLTNLDDVNAALAIYEALPADALALLDEEAQAYYDYLKGLQAALTEASPVFDLIQELPQDVEDLEESDFEDILAAVNAYNDLSEDAQALLDGELLMALLEEVASRAIDNLPVEEELTLEDEDAVVRAREAYDLLTEDQQEALGEDYLLRLQAAEARIAALKQTAWGDILTTFGVLLLHLAAAAYFVFLKRKDLAKLTGIKILAK